MATTSTKNPFTPDLRQTDTPTYIQNPVKEPSALGAVADATVNLLPGAITAYQNYKTAEDVIKPIDEALSLYESYYQNRPDLTAGAVQDQIDKTWEMAGTVPQDTTGMNLGNESSKLDLLDKSYKDNMELLINARKQGVISETGVLAKINQIVRQAVAKNPWMENVYYEKTRQYLDNAGIADLIKTRAKTASDEAARSQKYYDDRRTEMDKRDLQYAPGMPLEMMELAINEDKKNKYWLRQAEDANKGKLALADAAVLDLLQSGDLQKGHQLMFEKAQADAIKAYQNAKSPSEIEAITANFKLIHQSTMSNWRARFGANIVSPYAKDFLAAADNDFKVVYDALASAATGQQAATIIQNNLKNTQAAQEIAVRQQFNPYAINLAKDMIALVPPDKILEDYNNRGVIYNAITSSVELMKQGVSPNNGAVPRKDLLKGAASIIAPQEAGTKVLQDSAKNGSFAAAFDGLSAPMQSRGMQADTKIQLGQAMIAFNQTISSNMNVDDAYRFSNSIIAVAAKNSDNIRKNVATPLYAAEATKMIDFSMSKVVRDFVEKQGELASTYNIDVTIEKSPSGLFVINTKDPKLDQLFVEKFSNQINNALDAYSSARGVASKDIIDEFADRYFRGIMTTKGGLVSTTTAPTSDFTKQYNKENNTSSTEIASNDQLDQEFTAIKKEVSKAEEEAKVQSKGEKVTATPRIGLNNPSSNLSEMSKTVREEQKYKLKKLFAEQFEINRHMLNNKQMTKDRFNKEANKLRDDLNAELAKLEE